MLARQDRDVVAHRARERAEGEFGGWFGSTATHLLRKSAVPVWVMKPDPAPRYRRVLAAVDRDTMDPGREGLNAVLARGQVG